MQYTRNYDFTTGTVIVADQIDQEFNTVANVLNGNIDTTNIKDASVTAAKCVTAINPETRDNERWIDFVQSGLTMTPTSGWAGLSAGITEGVIYYDGKRVTVSAVASHNYTASKDTYVDVSSTGSFTYTAVANGAAVPSIAADSVRILKVVTSGAAITSFVDIRFDNNWHEVGGTGCPAFENSWANYNASTHTTCAFMMDLDGFVNLKGVAKSGTSTAAIFTLPAGYRPSLQQTFTVPSNDAFSLLTITSAGVVAKTAGGTNAYVSLDGIRFKVA